MSLPDAVANADPAAAAAFDLDAYIQRYAPGSETRLQRLAFIAEHTTDNGIKQSALDMLECQLTESGNTVKYQQVFSHTDEEWIRATNATNEASLEVLEARLSAAQANLNKDAIRTCYLNLGEFLLQKGQSREALRNILRSRDYCTNRAQTLHICWKVIELAMHQSNYAQVRDYVSKAEHSIVSGDMVFPRKLKVAAGLALLGEGKYKEASEKFASVKIPPEDIGTLCSPEDVALCSSLLALATMERQQLVRYLEDQPTCLELVPPVRDALRHYVRAEYRACLDALPPLHLDLHLAGHSSKLMDQIHNASFVDYLRPYHKVYLPHMAQLFGLETSSLTKSLAKLIGKGDIANARIDCRTQTLERTEKQDARLRKTQKRVHQLQQTVLDNTYAAMIRMACLENEPRAMSARGGAAAVFAAEYAPEDVLAAASSDEDSDAPMQMVFDNPGGEFAVAAAPNPEDDMF